MNRVVFLILLLLGMWNFQSRADHLLGGELYYSYIDGNTYQIELVLFADCSSSSGAFPGLWNSSPRVVLNTKIGNNFYAYDSLFLIAQAPIGEEITPLCPSELGNSSCSGGNLPGIRKFVFKGNYTLPANSGTQYNEWRFEFHGIQNITPSYLAGRSSLITNLTLPSGTPTILNLRAYLNRSVGENSSPRFNSLPTPFYCINKLQNYNIGAVDSNMDALTFNLVPALDNKCLTTASYVSGYSGLSPLAVANPISFNSITGQLSFLPNQSQNSVVVYEVTETRNGQVVGTSMREVIFIVISNCNNDAPENTITGVSNANINGQEITGCAGAPIQANLSITDPNMHNVGVSYYNLPAGAVLLISNNNTSNPSLSLTWPNPFPGTYVFYLDLVDDGCPLAVRQTVAVTINVITMEDPIVTVIEPTNCAGKAAIEYSFPNIGTNGPLDVFVMDANGNVLQNYTNITGSIIDSLLPGQYTIYSQRNPPGCTSGIVSFEVVDSGKFAYPPTAASPIYYCRNDVPAPLVASVSGPFSPTTLNWYSESGSPISGPPTPSTNVVGIFNWLVTQTYKTCESDPKIIKVYVTNPPGSTFEIPNPICQYDTIKVRFNGSYADSSAVDIQWDMSRGIIVDSGNTFGEILVTFADPGIYTVGIDAISEHQCYGIPNKKTVRVIPSTLTRLSGDTAVCQYEEITVSNTQPINPATDYIWETSENGVIISENPTNVRVRFLSPGESYIKLSAVSDSCTYVNYHYVYVHKKPEIELNIDNTTELCLGDTVIMRVDAGSELTFEPEVFAKQDPDSSNKYYLIILDATEFTLYAENEGGCLDTAYISIDNIKDCCKYFVPNAFTPNNDGMNDQFNAWFEGNPKNYHLQIFNRFGESVFSTLNKNDAWDGTYKGKPVDMGVYMYILDGECYENNRIINKTGDVTLIR